MSNKKGASPSASGSHSPSVSDLAQSRLSRSPEPKNIFSDDGSFLDRIRRSMKEEEDKKKAQAALERKHFADRFKNRGKRPAPDEDAPDNLEDGGSDPEGGSHRTKKVRLSNAVRRESENVQVAKAAVTTAQEDYQRAVSSYNDTLKDKGTGVRPLAK